MLSLFLNAYGGRQVGARRAAMTHVPSLLAPPHSSAGFSMCSEHSVEVIFVGHKEIRSLFIVGLGYHYCDNS